LDPYSARYCRHPHRSEVVGGRLDRQVFEGKRRPIWSPPIFHTRKEISNGIHHYRSTDRTVHYWLFALKPMH
jgi:hypothetical protein